MSYSKCSVRVLDGWAPRPPAAPRPRCPCCGPSSSSMTPGPGPPDFPPFESVVIGFLGLGISASRATWTSNWNAASFFTNFTVAKGRCCESYGSRVIDVSVAAIFPRSTREKDGVSYALHGPAKAGPYLTHVTVHG